MSDLSDTYDDDYYLGLPVDSGRIDAIVRLLDLKSDVALPCSRSCPSWATPTLASGSSIPPRTPSFAPRCKGSTGPG
jgi:hypothetical protein